MAFLIKYRSALALMFFGAQVIWISSGSRLMHPESIPFYSWVSLIFLFSFWLILLLDMIQRKIYNKTFWMISMLVLPALAPVLYLFQRKTLNHLRRNMFRKA